MYFMIQHRLSRFLSSLLSLIFILTAAMSVVAQIGVTNNKYKQQDKFRQLDEIWPTPSDTRTASGAPGKNYWQQKVDYEIDVRIDDEKQHLFGSETVTYVNNSPDPLSYLWLQLDANVLQPESDGHLSETTADLNRMEFGQMKSLLARESFRSNLQITKCIDASTNQPLKHTVVKTNMRIDLPEVLKPGHSYKFCIDWNYKINDAKLIPMRSGYELFEADGNYIYEMAQWFPRLCAYSDSTGWQHKQYLGRGEFALEMGDYVVRITIPNDHLVAATGVLLNPEDVLTEAQRARLEKSKKSKTPVFIVTPAEAKHNESSKPTGNQTWIFKADQVRDFAFASSRKFIWDAMQQNVGGAPVMAMSYYPNEAEPLWSKYSTHAIAHTLEVYSRYTFDYPYPVAISVNGPIYGMEYPMICFNGPRPDDDGTYSESTKYRLITVIIHEVGHNYFPMIVNSDEREWMWMDEGLNTFLQYLSEQEWEENYPSRAGEPRDIVGYMRSQNQVPIMTSADSLLQGGPNAYSKPCTALNILRETILGRELFDFAFKEYARRWKFKRPTPADFFRTMEDAAGVDLDWFWHGWFYTTDHVDLAIMNVRQLNVDTANPETELKLARQKRDGEPTSHSKERNEDLKKRTQRFPELKDFYNDYDELDATPQDKKAYQDLLETLTKEERSMLTEKRHFYLLDFKNVGGLVMPIIFNVEFEDGTSKMVRLPAEIWKLDNQAVTRMLLVDRPIKSIVVDPRLETADCDLDNNYFPRRISKSRFQLFKAEKEKNPMRTAAENEAEEAKEKSKSKKSKNDQQGKGALKKNESEKKPS